MSNTEVTEHVHAAPIADPSPLGLAGFAMTTFILSVFNAKILSASLESTVLPFALFYGGIAQFAAGMWEFRNKNTFGALAFTSYGSFWLTFAFYIRYVAGGLGPDGYKATGLFLLAWLIFTLYMTVAAIKTNVAVLAVFVALSLAFLFLMIGAFDQSTHSNEVGGYIGIVTAALAWYASMAVVVNSTWGRTLLPVWPID